MPEITSASQDTWLHDVIISVTLTQTQNIYTETRTPDMELQIYTDKWIRGPVPCRVLQG